MANTLKTKIQLLVKAKSDWEGSLKTYKPLLGEICIAQAADKSCTLKVGDGSSEYQNLPFVDSAKKYKVVKDATAYKWTLQESIDNGINWTDVSTIELQALVERIDADIAKKVDKEVDLGSGAVSRVSNNPGDQGAVMQVQSATNVSAVAVNNGGAGIGAQLYNWAGTAAAPTTGSVIDVTQNGIYYYKGAYKIASERDDFLNEIVVQNDIKELAGGMHFIGAGTRDTSTGKTIEQAIADIYASSPSGKTYDDRKPGDIVIVKDYDSTVTPVVYNDREFLCNSDRTWVELGDQALYATKAQLKQETEYRIAEDLKKVDKEITSSLGKARIFNEADGGGAKFENVDGTASFAGVNSDTNNGIGAQLYDIDVAANKGAKLDVTKKGIFYTVGDDSTKTPAQRDIPDNELVTKSKVNELASNKLDKFEPDAHSGFNAYNLPYYFETAADANKVTVTAHTVTLDNNKTYGQYSLNVPSATQSLAGLESAADKKKLDDFRARHLSQNFTEDPDDYLILDCNRTVI